MRRGGIPIITLITLMLLFSANGIASDGNIFISSARIYGMGGTHVAVADDATALFWNPAALTKIDHLSLVLSGGASANDLADWKNLINAVRGEDLTSVEAASLDGDIGSMLAISNGTFGAGFRIFGDLSAEVSGIPDAVGSVSSDLMLAYSRKLTSPSLGLGMVAIGATYRLHTSTDYQYSFDGSDWVMESSGRATQSAVDLGALMELTSIVSAGFVIKDVDSGLFGGSSGSNQHISLDIGVAMRSPITGLTLAADLEGYDLSNGEYNTLNVGVEKRFLGIIAIRGGYILPKDGESMLTAGFGVDLGIGRADIGVGLSELTKDKASASASIGVRF